jgi:hypothetical protein
LWIATPDARAWTAQECKQDDVCSDALNTLDTFRARLVALNSPNAAELCNAILKNKIPDSKIPSGQLACINTYKRFYAKDTIDIRIAYGYLDDEGGGVTEDYARKAAVVEHFKEKPCPPHYNACGFTQGDDPDVLTKDVTLPDGSHKKIVIRIKASAVSGDDERNRGDLKARQEEQSRKMKEFWSDSLRHGDAVFYDGHARDGGGPSFEPPHRIRDTQPYVACEKRVKLKGLSCQALSDKFAKLEAEQEKSPTDQRKALIDAAQSDWLSCRDKRSDCEQRDNHPDYNWYHHHRVAAEAMYKDLREAEPKPQPKLLSLNACYSRPHFGAGIAAAAPGTGFEGTRGLGEFDHMFGAPIAQIDSLLGMKCESDYMKSITAPADIGEFKDEPGKKDRYDGNPRLTGFFHK